MSQQHTGVGALEAGQSEVLNQYLSAMAKFHDYSFGNIMLIARQKPNATNVAGVRTWNSLGRFVRRGEKGILILVPMVSAPAQQNEGREVTEVAGSNEDAKQRQSKLFGFRAVYVFDVTQTEGKELAALSEVRGDAGSYRELLVKFVEAQGVQLNYSETIRPAKGLSHGGKITLLSGICLNSRSLVSRTLAVSRCPPRRWRERPATKRSIRQMPKTRATNKNKDTSGLLRSALHTITKRTTDTTIKTIEPTRPTR
jgi:hypothetical protein